MSWSKKFVLKTQVPDGLWFSGKFKAGICIFKKKKKKKATLHLIFSNEILKVYVREVKIEQRRRSKLEEWGVGAGGFASQENFLI